MPPHAPLRGPRGNPVLPSVVGRRSDRYTPSVHGPLLRRPARGRHYLVLLACLLPLLSVAPGRVLYHCLATGEVLTSCCRDIKGPSVAGAAAPCCEEPHEESSSPREHVADTECDCCDVVFEETRHPEALPAPSDSVVLIGHLAPVPTAFSAQPRLACRSSAIRLRLRAPPKRPLFLVFESFLS